MPGAAELLAPGHAEEAELAHRLDVVPGEAGRAVELARPRGRCGVRENSRTISRTWWWCSVK